MKPQIWMYGMIHVVKGLGTWWDGTGGLFSQTHRSASIHQSVNLISSHLLPNKSVESRQTTTSLDRSIYIYISIYLCVCGCVPSLTSKPRMLDALGLSAGPTWTRCTQTHTYIHAYVGMQAGFWTAYQTPIGPQQSPQQDSDELWHW